MVIDFIGWIGAVLLATCGLPQLIKTLKTRNFKGLSLVFVVWWLIGEILVLFYILYERFSWQLIFNYGLNILVCLLILEVYIITLYQKKSIVEKSNFLQPN